MACLFCLRTPLSCELMHTICQKSCSSLPLNTIQSTHKQALGPESYFRKSPERQQGPGKNTSFSLVEEKRKQRRIDPRRRWVTKATETTCFFPWSSRPCKQVCVREVRRLSGETRGSSGRTKWSAWCSLEMNRSIHDLCLAQPHPISFPHADSSSNRRTKAKDSVERDAQLYISGRAFSRHVFLLFAQMW